MKEIKTHRVELSRKDIMDAIDRYITYKYQLKLDTDGALTKNTLDDLPEEVLVDVKPDVPRPRAFEHYLLRGMTHI